MMGPAKATISAASNVCEEEPAGWLHAGTKDGQNERDGERSEEAYPRGRRPRKRQEAPAATGGSRAATQCMPASLEACGGRWKGAL